MSTWLRGNIDEAWVTLGAPGDIDEAPLILDKACFYCCLTFDFDAMSSWIGSAKSNNPSTISRGEFGARAIDRLLEMLERFEVRATFPTPGHTALAYPGIVRAIADAGHEITHHGWVHENPRHFEPPEEKEILLKGIDALDSVCGRRPVGYRSPAWDLSRATLDLLTELEFRYDSSCMGADFSPYYLRSGDRWSTNEQFHFGTPIDLVEMPVCWGLDDFPLSEYVPGFMEGMRPASQVEEMWRGDWDYGLENVPGGVFILTLHPQSIGRGNRMLMLERLLEYFSSDPRTRFTTMLDYADAWREQNPLNAIYYHARLR